MKGFAAKKRGKVLQKIKRRFFPPKTGLAHAKKQSKKKVLEEELIPVLSVFFSPPLFMTHLPSPPRLQLRRINEMQSIVLLFSRHCNRCMRNGRTTQLSCKLDKALLLPSLFYFSLKDIRI